MTIRLGIDIGMCFAKAAFISDNQMTLLRDPTSQSVQYPSSIYVDPQGRFVAGADAEAQRLHDPTHYRRYFKWNVYAQPELIDGRPVSYEDMMIAIITKMKRDFESMYGGLTSAAITVPGSYDFSLRKLISIACQRAGLRKVELIDGPAAVVKWYSLDSALVDEEPILVYNLGGCFDAAIVRKRGASYVAQGLPAVGENGSSVSGNYRIGGVEFDKKIYSHLENYLVQQVDSAWGDYLSTRNTTQEAMQARAHLRNVSQDLKHQLSVSEQSTLLFDPGISGLNAASCTLSRADFAAMIAPLIEKTIQHCRALVQRYVGRDQLSRVILVGGGANIPLVEATLAQQFARPVYKVTHTTIEAQGAAMYGTTQSSIFAVGRQIVKSLEDLADLFINELEPRPAVPMLTYKEAISYFTISLPPDPKVQKGAMLRQVVPYGVIFTQVFLDEQNHPVLRPDGQPYGRRLFVGQLDNELRNTFGSKQVVLVE
jgi:molecular chaperone DnaK (HSP70)